MPLMSGISPQRASSTDHSESGVAKRKSAASAIWMPPPKQWPCTAAMTGTGSRRQAQHASWKVLVPRQGRGTNALAMPRGLLHHRAEVEPGAERRALAGDDHGAQGAVGAQRRAVATSSSSVSRVSAFSLSGRLSRTCAMPSVTVQVTRSAIPTA